MNTKIKCKLVKEDTGEEVKVGDSVVSERDPKVKLKVIGFYTKPAPSTGRVVVKRPHALYDQEYYPSVFGLKIVEVK